MYKLNSNVHIVYSFQLVCYCPQKCLIAELNCLHSQSQSLRAKALLFLFNCHFTLTLLSLNKGVSVFTLGVWRTLINIRHFNSLSASLRFSCGTHGISIFELFSCVVSKRTPALFRALTRLICGILIKRRWYPFDSDRCVIQLTLKRFYYVTTTVFNATIRSLLDSVVTGLKFPKQYLSI